MLLWKRHNIDGRSYVYIHRYVCVLASVFRYIRDDYRVTSSERLFPEWDAFLENGNSLNENAFPFNTEVTAAGGQDSVIGIAT